MTYKALIVEDDLQIVDTIVDALASLGHEHDTAHSQSDALKWLTANDYTYVLLDIRIPARTRTGEPRIQNTENLLEKIAEIKDGNAPPVIILSDYIATSLDTTEDVMRLAMSLSAKGSADIIKKPFPTVGRTLDRVIKKVLGLNGKPRRRRRRKSTRAKKTRRKPRARKRSVPDKKTEKMGQTKMETKTITPFTGGVLAYYPDRVELGGETICEKTQKGYAWQILQVLRETNHHGKYIHIGSQRLAKRLDPVPQQNTLIRAIGTLRSRIGKIAEKCLGQKCGRGDVIANNGQGYHLTDSISVEVYDKGGTLVNSTGDAVLDGGMKSNGLSPLKFNNKHRWIMARLSAGGQVTRRDVQEHFKISARTAKRALSELTKVGLIEFDRSTHPGSYRIS